VKLAPFIADRASDDSWNGCGSAEMVQPREFAGPHVTEHPENTLQDTREASNGARSATDFRTIE
jgi:hypothetical protein